MSVLWLWQRVVAACSVQMWQWLVGVCVTLASTINLPFMCSKVYLSVRCFLEMSHAFRFSALNFLFFSSIKVSLITIIYKMFHLVKQLLCLHILLNAFEFNFQCSVEISSNN